ncbi:MAG TPA: hypothetical protein VEJ68_05740 [Candidatus Bathyarchaeia archaeon]|nr:hypothetical protein [Candidatus Bathyarchaeia archaeon]
MQREFAVVIIGVLTLLAASASAYGIMTLNTQIQANPDQTKMPDYSAQLDLLSSQIDSIKNQLGMLSYLQNNVTDIHTKLIDLDNLKGNITNIQQQLINLEGKNQGQQIASFTPSLTFVLDKSSYLPGNTIQITAIGAIPQNLIVIELLDSSQFVIMHQQAYADSAGKATYNMQLATALLPGNYVLKLTSGQQVSSQPIQILSSGTSQSTTPTSNSILTVQTDKSVYLTGEEIQVAGKAQPNTTVSSVMKSPTGVTYNSVTTADAGGLYNLFYSPLHPYETGQWSITVSNLTTTTTVYITIQQN